MSNEAAIHTGLRSIHELIDAVHSIGDKGIAYWAQCLELKRGSKEMEVVLLEMDAASKAIIEILNRTTVIASGLCACLPDRKERNAVVLGAMRRISEGYQKLFQLGEAQDRVIALMGS